MYFRTMESNWNLTNDNSFINNCDITVLEKVEINNDQRKMLFISKS